MKIFGIILALLCSPAFAFDDAPFKSKFCKEKEVGMRTKAVTQNIAIPMNRFSLSLARLHFKSGENFVISPFSAHVVLAMVAQGARKDTEKELLKTLIPKAPKLSGAELADLYHDLLADLTCPRPWSNSQMTIANGLFKQKGKKFLAEFESTNRAKFDGLLQTVDYKSPDLARKTINEWVNKITRGLIPNLIPERVLTPDTKLTLVNAIHVKDQWANTFEKEDTKPKLFKLQDGTKIKTATMFRKGKAQEYAWYGNKTLQAISMPTESGVFDLTLIVPRNLKGTSKLMQSASYEDLSKIMDSLKPATVHLSLPKFKVESAHRLEKTLEKMGVKKAFVARVADLSGIDGGDDLLFISAILQKAIIKIDENGLEAAAATAAMARAGGMPPKPKEPVVMKVDRPFLYILRHRLTGAWLFVGSVFDPR